MIANGRLARLFVLFAVALSPGFAAAKDWPDKPIRIVVPFPPGGTTDIMGRLMASRLHEVLGSPVLVENIAGAGGRIGAERVARSEADGYTLLLGSPGPLASYQFLYKSMSYDSRTAFAPVVLVATLPQVLVVRGDSPIASVSQLLESLRQRSGSTTFGTPGMGSSQHFTTELFMSATGTRAQNVVYKGSAPMLNDVVAGVTDFAFDQLTSAMGLIKSGRLRAIAVTSPARSKELPDVPTLSEAGVPVNYSVWFALAAPRGTPQPIIDRLNRESRRILAESEVKERIAAFGAVAGGGSPADLQRVIDQEVASVKQILATTPIELD